MDILLLVVTAVNYVLYFALMVIVSFFDAFGLNWALIVTGMVVISVLLRLFVQRLVGTTLERSVNPNRSRSSQVAEGKKARASVRRGASTSSRLKRSDYTFSKSSAARDHFIKKIRKE